MPCWNIGTLLQMKPDSVFEKLVRCVNAVWFATSEFAVAERVMRIKKLPVELRAGAYWLLDFGKGSLNYFRWKRIIDSLVNSVDFLSPCLTPRGTSLFLTCLRLGTGSRLVHNPAA